MAASTSVDSGISPRSMARSSATASGRRREAIFCLSTAITSGCVRAASSSCAIRSPPGPRSMPAQMSA